jgi:hypothetical protein
MASIPKTYLSFHSIHDIKAQALDTLDTPLILQLDGEYGAVQIAIYSEQPDADRVRKLADAINDVLRQPEQPEAACPAEKAAYASADEYWNSLQRDLNRHPINKPDGETRR